MSEPIASSDFAKAVPAVSIVAEVAPAATSTPFRKPLLSEPFSFSISQSPSVSESVLVKKALTAIVNNYPTAEE